MVGGIGNDAYGIDSLSDVIIENANEGIDAAIFFANNYTLASNVENGNVGSTTGLALTGNELGNALVGNSGADILDGGAGIDSLFGWTGDDTFVFHAGQANGDTVIDFAGNGSNPGDQLQFVG
jgi:Ca2+-binding RTX toxin-like protein